MDSGTEEPSTDESNCEPSPSSSPSENEEQYGAGEKRRREKSRKTFFEGQARKPYRLRKRLRRSMEDSDTVIDGVCKQCAPALGNVIEGFRKLKHQGSELKKRRKRYPAPKHADREHYRDLVAQNAWIRGNIFDPMGNYLFCHDCVRKALGISKQRLARQRQVKRKLFKQQETTMAKKDVDTQKLTAFVVMPLEIELCFKLWWKDLPDDHEVVVRFPHERHGLAGKVSNHAKTATKERFLEFVEENSQPNGRRLDSRNPTHFFKPKFTTISAPKKNVHNYDGRLATSLVGEFNRIQVEDGCPTISDFSATSWLKKECPKHAIYPHKADYCDTCAKVKAAIQEKQTSINRKLQSGSADATEIAQLEKDKQTLVEKLQKHKDVARESLQYYKEIKEKCCSQWKEIATLDSKSDRSSAEDERLEQLKHCFTLVMSADYQMQKLVPYWGSSPQPGSTYYLQKLSYDLFGIVDHRDESSAVYVFDERVGHQNSRPYHLLYSPLPQVSR